MRWARSRRPRTRAPWPARSPGRGLGNRATQALIAREEDAPYEFSDDPLAADWTPDNSIRVKPGPVRATLIRPKAPPLTKKGEWLETALKQDPLLKALPNWARDKAIDGLKDIDETIAEKIIEALPWESGTKEAATAALKALLQTAKGKKFETAGGAPQSPFAGLDEAAGLPGRARSGDHPGPRDQVVRPLVVVALQLGADLAAGVHRRVHVGVRRAGADRPQELVVLARGDALAGRADHVGRLDRSADRHWPSLAGQPGVPAGRSPGWCTGTR